MNPLCKYTKRLFRLIRKDVDPSLTSQFSVMSSTASIQVNGAIEFHFSITDWELAKKIDQLLKENVDTIVEASSTRRIRASSRIHNDDGHAKQGPETKDRILEF